MEFSCSVEIFRGKVFGLNVDCVSLSSTDRVVEPVVAVMRDNLPSNSFITFPNMSLGFFVVEIVPELPESVVTVVFILLIMLVIAVLPSVEIGTALTVVSHRSFWAMLK